ncbi:MAG: hypothetical protein NW223_04990 [Hyphomicrobiaceae bacterium]|nr:hypothetical protein [Hyphomicrobiaceae bacterium]
MARVLAFAVALLLALDVPGALAASKRKPLNELATQEHVLRWINGYRLRPEPRKLPAAVKAMSELGLFRELDQAGVYIGFMAGVLQTNPDKAEDLVTRMFPIPPEDQVPIVRAIAYSDLPGWKELMLKFVERMPARKGLIDRFVYGKQPTLKQLPLDDGTAPLDMLWGLYFATGSPEPVLRIISILSWARDRDNVERLTIGNMAKLSLATNASRDKALLDLVKAALNTENAETRVVLQEVIDAAETFEFGRVRKDAMAAIEKLKAKGPESARNTQWWGMVGQTALAVGCVAASALGQVQIGIPCVVGGAASSAALKFMTPN